MATMRLDHMEEALWAAKAGDEQVLRARVEAWGPGVDIRDEDGSSLLALAVAGGHEGCAKILVSNGCDIDAKDDFMCAPLMIACGGGWGDMQTTPKAGLARLLLQAGADVEAARANGETALMMASRWGAEDIVGDLLAAGADADASDDDGFTALMHAGGGCNYKCVARLIAAGCDLEKVNRGGETAASMARASSASGVNGSSMACVGAIEAERERRALGASAEGESVKKPSLRM